MRYDLFRHLPRVALAAVVVGFTACSTVPEVGGWFDGPPHSGRRIVIDLGDQRAYLYDGKRLLAESPISSGREGKNTPTGTFRVIQKSPNHRSSIYGNYVRDGRIVKANVDNRKDRRPAGSKFVGAPMPYFLRFTGAYGLHAGYVARQPVSNGCVRLPNSQARRFYHAVSLGTPVVVRK